MTHRCIDCGSYDHKSSEHDPPEPPSTNVLTLWVCNACGKTAATHDDFQDPSCRTRAVECYATSIVRRSDGRVTHAQAVDRGRA